MPFPALPKETPLPKGKPPVRLEPFSDNRARYLFYRALEKDTPETLASLRDDVFPAYCALTVEIAQRSYPKVGFGLRPRERMKTTLDIDPEFQSDLPVCWWTVERGASKTAEAGSLY